MNSYYTALRRRSEQKIARGRFFVGFRRRVLEYSRWALCGNALLDPTRALPKVITKDFASATLLQVYHSQINRKYYRLNTSNSRHDTIFTMRKRTKSKLRSCALCKPLKTGHSCRWSARDVSALQAWEKEKDRLLKEQE